MKRQTFNENHEPSSAPAIGDRSLMCRMPGCSLRWAVDVSHGRVCSFHDEQLSNHGVRRPGLVGRPTPLGARPLAEALPHWQDEREDV